MIEKSKSTLLFILVALSLLQSYMLAYSLPSFHTTNEGGSGYVKTDLDGKLEKAENLLQPQQMIVHFGKEQHTVLYPDTQFYNLILQRLKGRTFDGFQRLSMSTVDWSEVRSQYKGVEIRFNEGIPINILDKIMQIQGDLVLQSDTINRIWIYMKDNKEEVRTFFLNEEGTVIYESTKADLTVKDVEEFVGFGEYQTRYRMVNGDYYLPLYPIKIVKYKLRYKEFSSEQMQKSLFLDPGITRSLPERDGSEIYTDSKRGLRVRTEQKWISFTDPIAPVDGENDLRENLYAAVQFVNQHGGWNGDYLLHMAGNKGQEGDVFVFQQYYGSYPIVSDGKTKYGEMRLSAQKGTVSSYERSLVNLDKEEAEKSQEILPGGTALDTKLANFAEGSVIKTVFPAYRPQLTKETLELTPVWVIEFLDGTRTILR